MNFKQHLTTLVLPAVMLISGGSYAAVMLPAIDIQQMAGDVDYTGGSLMGSLSGGRLEGDFIGADLLLTKLGPVTVIPVPAAIWLFASGLISLFGITRRKV